MKLNRIEGIDGSELEAKEIACAKAGDIEGSNKYKNEFLEQASKLPDHCSCPENCRHHGNCYECVIVHRGHRDHLPYCFWDMVNEKIECLSCITEGSFKKD